MLPPMTAFDFMWEETRVPGGNPHAPLGEQMTT